MMMYPARYYPVPMRPPQQPTRPVPLVRDWFSPAVGALARGLYGWGRGYWIAFGFLFWFLMFLEFMKMAIFVTVVMSMLLVFGVTAVIDLCTYRKRAWRAAHRRVYW